MIGDVLRPWHDFYSLVGTAAATLIGLLFVAASVGSGIYRREKHYVLRTLLSPSVVYFACVLATCLVCIAPLGDWPTFGRLIASVGAFGLVYALVVARVMTSHGMLANMDWEDRIGYAALPVLAHALLVAAGVMLDRGNAEGMMLLVAATGLLICTSIRNAWDMTVWIVIRGNEPPAGPPGG